MIFSTIDFFATMILARNSQMRCKGGNTHAVLSPYMTPTYILMSNNNKKKKKNKKNKKKA